MVPKWVPEINRKISRCFNIGPWIPVRDVLRQSKDKTRAPPQEQVTCLVIHHRCSSDLDENRKPEQPRAVSLAGGGRILAAPWLQQQSDGSRLPASRAHMAAFARALLLTAARLERRGKALTSLWQTPLISAGEALQEGVGVEAARLRDEALRAFTLCERG